MQSKTRQRIITLVEGALMVALAIVLDLIPLPKWPQGGSISIAAIPIIYYSYRRGPLWGLAAGLVNGVIQIITGWYMPPAGTFWAVVGCVLLDYLLAFGVIGIAGVFSKLFGKYRLVGYGVGAFLVGVLRFLCSFLSGFLLWGSYAPENQSVIWYSLTYNGSYMLPNAVLYVVLIVILCAAVDPTTLRPMKRRKTESAD